MAKCLAQKQEDDSLALVGGASNMVTAAKLAALTGKVKQGCFPNKQIVITTSGDWEAPFTGWAEVTVIGGGDGGYCCQRNVWVGAAGSCSRHFVQFEKGQIIPITIGTGGQGQDRRNDFLYNSSYGALTRGGASSFGDLTSSTGPITWRDQGEFMQAPGDGACNLAPRRHIAGEFPYGMGGVGAWAGTGATPSGASATNGSNGAVIINYYNIEAE